MAEPQTPFPGPGRFYQTPQNENRIRPLSFGATPDATRQRQDLAPAAGSQLNANIPRQPENLTAAERTGKAVNAALNEITLTPPLETSLGGRIAYNYEMRNTSAWAPFQKYKSHPIPDQIFDQMNRSHVITNMGLFAEIHHAWVTVDNALYMWDYTQPNAELLGFEDQPYSIVEVKLAKPKAGVFLNSIVHMIVMATTDQMMLLGLGEDPATPGAGLTLFQTGMASSIKGLHISQIICSAKSGRVFFGCNTDDDVRELVYQAQDSWFSSRCSVKNHTQNRILTNLTGALTVSGALSIFSPTTSEHVIQMDIDDSRDLLYTLSSASNIRAFLIPPGDGMLEKRATTGIQKLSRNVDQVLSRLNVQDTSKIKAINVIKESEAANWVLVVTTAEGYRIYLGGSFNAYTQPKMLNELSVVHTRTPPMLALDNGEPGPVTFEEKNKFLLNLSCAYRFAPGYFFAARPELGSTANDRLFVSVPEQFERGSQEAIKGTECAAWIDVRSNVVDIGFPIPYQGATQTPPGFNYELAMQYDAPVPEVAVLTNTGVHLLRRKRFVDTLANVIRDNGGQEGFQNEIQLLISRYGRREILADALAVACGQSIETSSERAIRINDPHVLEAARKIFIDHGGRPSLDQNTTAAPIDSVRLSPRYEASVRYLSRLIRSTWKQVIPREDRSVVGLQILCSIKPGKLREVQENLTSLHKFFTNNKTFIRGLSGPEDLATQSSRDDEIALQGEHRALNALVKFIAEMIEAMSFILVLFDEKVVEIVPLLPEQSRDAFMTLTFENLVSSRSGISVAKDLVKAIVNRNIAKGSNVETIAEALRRKCGSFCSADDVVIFKAQELLKRASELRANAEASRNSLNESLRLFQQVAKSLPAEYLQSAVNNYVELQFFAGAIQLTLKVAYENDPTNEAQTWQADGEPQNDSRKEKYDARVRCYNLIHEVLEAIDRTMQSNQTFVDGRPSLSAVRRDEAYEVIAQSKDEVFLTNLYDWYMTKGWTERLLSTDSNSGFIVNYLQRRAEEGVTYADLLWQYYGKNSQFHEAAKVQLKLAQSAQYELPLDRRLEYLSRARANASAFTTANNAANRKTKQKLLTEINSLIDLATIQDEILSKLRDDDRLKNGLDSRDEEARNNAIENRDRVLGQLNGAVLPISDLYNSWAESAGYYDICLFILAVADHREATEIRTTWEKLLNATYYAVKAEYDRAVAADQAEAPRAEGAGSITHVRDVANPTEVVAGEFLRVARRVQSSEAVFPVPLLIEMLERFNSTAAQNLAGVGDDSPGLIHWIPNIFLELEVTFEQLYESLESVYLASNAPGARASERRIILSDLLYTVERWFDASSTRAGQTLFGGEAGQIRIEELLKFLTEQNNARQIGEAEYRLARDLRNRVAELVG